MRRNPFPCRFSVLALCSVVGGLSAFTSSAAGSAPPADQPAMPAAGPDSADENAEREVLVVLRSGQRVTGILAEVTEKTLTVKVSGINASFSIADVERYEFLPPLMERYRDLRAAVGNDPDQIARLAEWLRERGKYELALSEIDRALEIRPDHAECLRLKLELEQQILLRSRAKTRPQPEPAANPADTPGGGEAAPRRSRITDFPLLTPAQMDLIKVYEVDLAEKPRIIVPRDAMERLMAANTGHPLIPVTKEGRESLLRKSPAEQLELIFRLQARDLYAQIQILDMPGSIRKFRDNVHATWLLNSCATTMCHGGSDAGRFVLATRRPNHDQTVYTNLLILQKFRLRDGQPLIDWENPERSPLLQLALPRQDSLVSHPIAPLGAAGRDGWKPAFRDANEKLFVKSVEWIRSMYKPRPDYQIPYTPIKPFEPVPVSAAKPAPAPPKDPARSPGVPESGSGPADAGGGKRDGGNVPGSGGTREEPPPR